MSKRNHPSAEKKFGKNFCHDAWYCWKSPIGNKLSLETNDFHLDATPTMRLVLKTGNKDHTETLGKNQLTKIYYSSYCKKITKKITEGLLYDNS